MLATYPTMMMEAVSACETSVNFYQTTWRNIPEDSHLQDSSHRRNVQAGSGVHPASYPVGTGVHSSRRQPDHSPPSSAEVKNAWSFSSTPPYVCMDIFTFTEYRFQNSRMYI
jgi:hypothetical protein